MKLEDLKIDNGSNVCNVSGARGPRLVIETAGALVTLRPVHGPVHWLNLYDPSTGTTIRKPMSCVGGHLGVVED